MPPPSPPITATARFHLSHHHHTFQWNRAISEATRRHPTAALFLFQHMQSVGAAPNRHTFPPLLRAAATAAAADIPIIVPQLHAQTLRRGLAQDPFVASALLAALGRHSPAHARKLFDEIPLPARDVVAWTSLVSALAATEPDLALIEFLKMRRCHPVDAVVLGAVLPAAAASSVTAVLAIHGGAIKCGVESDIHLANTLVHIYGKCGLVYNAQTMFLQIPVLSKNLVSWNSMIAAFVTCGQSRQGIAAFSGLLSAGYAPNHVTLLTLMKAGAEIGCLNTCRIIHGCNVSYGLENGVEVATAILTMYARSGDLDTAHCIFDAVECKNVVCWSAMIAGCELNSSFSKALGLFRRMLGEEANQKPNEVTLLSSVAACGGLGSIRLGKTVHKYALMTGMDMYCSVASSLIDMYAKSGDIGSARKVFETMCVRSFVMWSAMIGAEGLHGHGREALRLFSQMVSDGHSPNEVTFISLLSACSHAGLVEDGLQCFNSMEEHGVSPTARHYACVVDLLGRDGRLNDAHNLILGMEANPDVAVWGSLLGACRVHKNCELGEVAERELMKLDPSSVGHHVLLANMFNEAGREEDVIRMRVAMKTKGLRKTAGLSFVEFNGHVYSFGAGDRLHCGQEVYDDLHALEERVKQAGLAIGGSFDEGILSRGRYHSERLATAFALNRVVGVKETIRITKNLRFCVDCHAYMKLVSMVCEMELVVRDAHRFHHFNGGTCSCGDYW